MLPIARVDTPDQRTIEQITQFLGVSPRALVKTLIYLAGDRVVAALVRGDRELSEDKLKQALGVSKISMADPDTIARVSGAPVGFAGPVGIKECLIIADEELHGESNFITGGNEADLHLRNVNWERDFEVAQWAPLRLAEPGDACGRCGKPLSVYRGIELAHIFKLGTIYSEAMGAFYQDDEGQRKPIVMGCYGLGTTRMLSAIAEHCHDDNGLMWPPAVAPFDAVVIPVNHDQDEQRALGDEVYADLVRAGFDTLLEDRAERPGVKFKDADLIGVPGQVVVGRMAGEGKVEVRRRGGSTHTIPAAEAPEALRNLLAQDNPD
jgi:prolyl-tRNA synthetase